ncbi:hypothetical protein WJX72_011937 [[Myrmecia] bisecta]|uniref:Uncharacterized protein n=1 Tax=[Myrmecia] bisecta TaxID=41462 RepID=A0AAW1PIJ1_9CHLO
MADRLWARERPAGSRRSAKKRRNAKIHCAAGTLGSGCHSMLQCKMPAATQDSSKQQEVYSPVALCQKVPVVGEAYRDAREGREGLLSHTDPPQLQLPPARLDTIGWVGFRTSLLRVAVHRAQLQRAAQAVHLADKKELRKRICELSQALEMTDLPATTSCCRSKSRLAPAYTNAGGLRWPA